MSRRGGRGWALNRRANRWKYLDNTRTLIKGIKRVIVKDKSRNAPGLVQILVLGKRGDYPVVTADIPVNATLVLGGAQESASGQCGETVFEPHNCSFNRSGRTLTCR